MPAVLLSINLEAYSQQKAAIAPILAECGGKEVGPVGPLFVAAFPATFDAAVIAANCAQRLQLSMPKGAPLVLALHVGEPSGDGLKTLLEMRKVTSAGGLSVSQALIELGGGNLPMALEPLENSQGMTGFFTTARTRFIDMSATAPPAERTNTKLTYAPTSSSRTDLRKPVAAPSAAAEAAGAGMSSIAGFLGNSNIVFLLKMLATIAVVLAGVKLNGNSHVFDKGKEMFARTSIGKTMAEKSAKLDAQVMQAGKSITAPIDIAKAAAQKAGAVPQELLDLSPEIDPQTVIGKPPGAAAAAVAAASAGSGTGSGSGMVETVTSESGSGSHARTPAAVSPGESAAPTSSLDDALFVKCQTDAAFCQTTAQTLLKDGNYASAGRFFKQGCEMGQVKSCTQGSAIYQNGVGVERNEAVAKSLLEIACTKDDGPSCTEVGLAHLHGAGLAVSLTKARDALERGCTLGHGPACLLLGLGAQKKEASAEKLTKGCAIMNIVDCAAH